MKLKLVTVAFDLEMGAFPPDPLKDVDGEVLSVVEHFFHHGGLPHLLLVVHHRPESILENRMAAVRGIRDRSTPARRRRHKCGRRARS